MSKKVIRTRNLKLKRTKAKNFFLKFFTWLLILVALGSIGFYVTEYFSNNFSKPNNSSIIQSSQNNNSIVDSSLNSSSVDSNISTSVSESINSSNDIGNQQDEIACVTMPLKTALDETLYKKFISNAKKDGYTHILLQLKEDNGDINYDSKVKLATKCNAIISNPINLKKLAKEITNSGLKPIALMSALKDPKAAHVNYGTSYKYGNTNFTWYDNSVENGGKPWLNPYLDNTQNYLCDLTSEVAKLGFKNILLSNMNFPTQYTSNINYVDKNMNENKILNYLTSKIANKTAKNGATVSIYSDIANNFTDMKKAYGTQLEKVVGTVDYSPYISLADIEKNLMKNSLLGGLNINGDTKEIVNILLSNVKSKMNINCNIIPVVAYKDKDILVPILKELNFNFYIIK